MLLSTGRAICTLAELNILTTVVVCNLTIDDVGKITNDENGYCRQPKHGTVLYWVLSHIISNTVPLFEPNTQAWSYKLYS